MQVEQLTPYKKKKKGQPGSCVSLAHAWVLRSGHSVSVTCMAKPESIIITTWAQKGRKRMLLRQTENYDLPDLLAYKINKGTATAGKFVCVYVCVCCCLYPLYFHFAIIVSIPNHTAVWIVLYTCLVRYMLTSSVCLLMQNLFRTVVAICSLRKMGKHCNM